MKEKIYIKSQFKPLTKVILWYKFKYIRNILKHKNKRLKGELL